MDRFEDLRTYVQVVESGSLTRAAETLGVATSAVSRRVRDLETRLGVQLLQRTTRQMSMTAAGERFHTRAIDVLNALDAAEAEAGDAAQALKGPLRIAAPLSFGQSHLGPILIDFIRAHPDVDLDVDLSDRFVDLVAEGHDLAIRIGPGLRDSSLVARKLCDVRLVLAASPGFWAEHGDPARPEDLAHMPGLIYRGSERGAVLPYIMPDGREGTIEINASVRATNGDFLCAVAAAGLGWVVQPSFIAARALEEGILVPRLLDVTWPGVSIFAVYPETRHLSARARAFIDFVRERIGPRPDWEAVLDRV